MQKKKTTKINANLFVLLALCITLAIAGCSNTETNETIKIGYIGPLAGNFADFGEGQLNAINIAVKEVNDKGGINGKKVQLIAADTKHLTQETVTATHQLINEDIIALIGPTGSSNIMAIASLLNEKQLPTITSITTSPVVQKAGPYVFRTMPDVTLQTIKIAEYMSKQDIQSVSIIYVENDFGQGVVDAFSKNYDENIISKEAHEFGEKDFRASLTKAKNKKTQAVFIATYPTEAANLIKQAKEIDYQGVLIGVETVGTGPVREIAGNAREGIIFAKPTPLATEEFKQKYKQAYGIDPVFSSDNAYDNFMLLTKAIEQCGVEGEAIRICLHQIGQNYEGVSGLITFDEKGDVNKPLSLYIVKDGVDVLVE